MALNAKERQVLKKQGVYVHPVVEPLEVRRKDTTLPPLDIEIKEKTVGFADTRNTNTLEAAGFREEEPELHIS